MRTVLALLGRIEPATIVDHIEVINDGGDAFARWLDVDAPALSQHKDDRA